MFRGDGSANFSANTLPEMVLPMSLQLGLTDAGRNESQVHICLLIPQFCSVNRLFLSDGAQSYSTIVGARRPHRFLPFRQKRILVEIAFSLLSYRLGLSNTRTSPGSTEKYCAICGTVRPILERALSDGRSIGQRTPSANARLSRHSNSSRLRDMTEFSFMYSTTADESIAVIRNALPSLN
jgi:hypothetical protein